jgi:hypothetical protein
LLALAASTSVVISTAGPFSQCGTPLVGACAASATDYVDINGETPWVRSLIDRFDGSLRLARRIVDLKKQYPDRVFFLAGNRDLNKVRFTSELSDDDMRRPYASIPGPHWDPKAPTLAQYLERLAAERGVDAQSLDTKAERLRYYLTHTLGCPGGFELRRRELGLLAAASAKPGAQIEPITDEQVVDSMVDDIRPRAPAEARMGVLPARECMGVLREYLQLAQLVVILGNTMWVHGALDAITIGIVPEDGTRFCAPAVPQPFRTVEGGVAAWANEMNARNGKAMIIGPADTPYAWCPLVFSIDCPTDYPFSSPAVCFMTSDGVTRFHPNLYVNGKVCLSILGTWSGPPW